MQNFNVYMFNTATFLIIDHENIKGMAPNSGFLKLFKQLRTLPCEFIMISQIISHTFNLTCTIIVLCSLALRLQRYNDSSICITFLQQFDSSISWQPIPIHTVAKDQDLVNS